MELEFRVEERAEQPAVSMRTQVPMSELPAFFERAFPAIMGHITAAGQHPAGPPFALYRNQDMDNFDIEAAFPVAEPMAVEGELQAIVVPGGKVCTTILTGPYDGLPQAWEALTNYATSEGLESHTWGYEIYLNDPGSVPPEEIQTQLVLPLV